MIGKVAAVMLLMWGLAPFMPTLRLFHAQISQEMRMLHCRQPGEKTTLSLPAFLARFLEA